MRMCVCVCVCAGVAAHGADPGGGVAGARLVRSLRRYDQEVHRGAHRQAVPRASRRHSRHLLLPCVTSAPSPSAISPLCLLSPPPPTLSPDTPKLYTGARLCDHAHKSYVHTNTQRQHTRRVHLLHLKIHFQLNYDFKIDK